MRNASENETSDIFLCFYSSQDRDGEGWILLKKTWRRPGEDLEILENLLGDHVSPLSSLVR